MSRYRFVLAASPFVDADLVRAVADKCDVEVSCSDLSAADSVAEATKDAEAVIVVTNPLPAEIVGALAPSIRLVGRAGVGLDAIDLEAARGRGIAVFHTPDYCVDEVATHAVAMALALNRKLLPADALARRSWGSWRELAPVAPLGEQTAGVVGMGRIGRAVVSRLLPLIGEVLAYDPWVSSEVDGVTSVDSLEELLRRSDVVTLHLPLSDDTTALIGVKELAQMRPGAYLVNVSRGALVDEVALADALSNGRIAGAALDVLTLEPPRSDNPLLSAPNVLLSPHLAWYSTGSESRVWTMTIEGMVAYLGDHPLASGRLAVDPHQSPSPAPR